MSVASMPRCQWREDGFTLHHPANGDRFGTGGSSTSGYGNTRPRDRKMLGGVGRLYEVASKSKPWKQEGRFRETNKNHLHFALFYMSRGLRE